MEKELNIAAILNEKPTETKLWSPMLGDCIYCYNNTYPDEIIIAFTDKNGEEKEWTFSYSGRTISAPDTADVCLFPSKQMQDWSKFAWKKGDVLVNSRGLKILFDRWANDNYTSFYAKTTNLVEDAFLDTNLHTLASEKEAKTFIKCIEEKFGGKLNLETLEIEQPKPEFKDGDIVYNPAGDFIDEAIFIAKVETKGVLYSYVYMSKDSMIPLAKSSFSVSGCLDSLRLATDSEKQELFSALEKKNKRWNPDTKQIEDLPKKCEFKPFQKVLAKFDEDCEWMPDFFYHYDKSDSEMPYVCIANGRAIECIPYNDETKHLLGTTDEWKGGEG